MFSFWFHFAKETKVSIWSNGNLVFLKKIWWDFYRSLHFKVPWFHERGLKKYLSLCVYMCVRCGWWLFNQEILSKKTPFIFWNFNLRFFICKFHRIHFRYFSNLTLDLKKNIFWDLRPKRILLCVSEGRSQKLNLVT